MYISLLNDKKTLVHFLNVLCAAVGLSCPVVCSVSAVPSWRENTVAPLGEKEAGSILEVGSEARSGIGMCTQLSIQLGRVALVEDIFANSHRVHGVHELRDKNIQM